MRRISRSINKLSIRTKFIAVLVISVFLMFVFNYFASNAIFKLYEDKIYKQSEDIVNIYSSAVENELSNTDDFSKSVFESDLIQDILIKRKGNPSKAERYDLIEELKRFMWGYDGRQKYIKSMFFIDELQSTHVIAGDASININVIKEQINERLAGREDSDKWFAISEYPEVVFKAYEIINNKAVNNESLGIIITCVDIKNLGSNFEIIVRARSLSNFFIINDTDILFGNMSEAQGKGEMAKQIIKLKGDKNNFILTDEAGNRYIVARHVSSDTKWQYVNISQYSSVFKDILRTKERINFVYLLILIVVILIGWKFSDYIINPIRKLSNKMNKISETGTISELDIGEISREGQGDEISVLNKHFSEALGTIKNLTDENMAKQGLLQETRYNALQLQIRPHFLYNTLETIKCLGIMGKTKELNLVLDDLGNLLRRSLKSSDTVTIEEELIMLHHYINIQKVRYEERLDYSEKIDAKLFNIYVPKMILQPLVENAINYGLDSMTEKCIIALYSEELEDHYQIIVEDNGPGMDKDFLTKLKRHEIKPKGLGIGLANIDARLKMVFGEDYGLFINSVEGQGTCVSIRIPKANEQYS